MREIMVKYVLDDEHERKLKEIASEYKKTCSKRCLWWYDGRQDIWAYYENGKQIWHRKKI